MENGMDAGMLALMKDQNGMNQNPWWPLVWLAFLGRGGLFGNEAGTIDGAIAAKVDANKDLIMQAVSGSNDALTALATTLNCDLNALKECCCTVRNQICQDGSATRETVNNVGNLNRETLNRGFADSQMGMAAGFANLNTNLCNQFNGIQSSLASLDKTMCMDGAATREALAKCCCEAQLRTAEQTAALTAQNTNNTQRIIDAINAQTTAELQDKLSQCRSNLSNCEQTGAVAQIISNQTSQILQHLPWWLHGNGGAQGGPPGPPAVAGVR